MKLHLSNRRRIGQRDERTECGRSFRITGGLRDTPHPKNLGIYRDEPCKKCFRKRNDWDSWACLAAVERGER